MRFVASLLLLVAALAAETDTVPQAEPAVGVWGLGFGALGLEFRVWGLGFGALGLGLRICGLGFRV